MGKIQVGQKRPKTVDMGGFTIAPNGGATVGNKGGMTAEEKKALIDKIMEMPKDKIVPELRKHGFNEIADITEVQMKQVQSEAQKQTDEAERQKEARESRLQEILALPDEEQLPLLLAEGYKEEAKELSERLAAEKAAAEAAAEQEQTGEGTGEENTGIEAPADGTTSELNDEGAGTEAPESAEVPADAEEPEKKKGGRSKKTESK